MATRNPTDKAQLSVGSTPRRLTSNRIDQCPCCGSLIDALPTPWTIEPCGECRRPLTLVWYVARPRVYRLHNVLEMVGAIYGLSTLALITAFVLFEMDARTFAKAVTVLLFVIASMLSADGVLGLRSAIDKSWNVTRRGRAARVRAGGKVGCGIAGFALTLVGLAI